MRWRPVSLFFALALVVSACGDDTTTDTGEAGAAEAGATDDPDGSDGAAETTAPTETTAPPTTDGGDAEATTGEAATGGGEASGGGADCLIGTWEAPRDAVEDQVTANLATLPGVSPALEDGKMTAEFRPDMTADFVTQARVSGNHPDVGRIEGTMDGLFVVDWVVEADVLTYTAKSFDLVVSIDGLTIPDVPGPAEGDEASVTFTCAGDQLEIVPNSPFARLPPQWTRVG